MNLEVNAKSETKASNLSRYFQFFLVVLAAGAIFPVIYLKTSYQETILEVFNMQIGQLNNIYLVLGWVFVVGYFPSGLLSDKFSAKKLLSLSLFGVALGGFWFAQIPSYTSVVIIFCIWGTFSVFTFWSAHMKLVKLLAKKEEEGKFFGILDGGRGALEAVLAMIAVGIFSSFLPDAANATIEAKRTALVSVIYMYSFVVLAVAILSVIFIKDDSKTEKVAVVHTKKEKNKIDFKALFENKLVFLMGGIIFMTYSVYWTIYYLGGFLQTNVGLDATKVAGIMAAAFWMRPFGGTIIGVIGDAKGKAFALTSATIGAAACLVVISILPTTLDSMVFYALTIGCCFFLYCIRGSYWSLLGECDIDDKIVGIAIGLVSLIGYMPDIFLPPFNTFLFKTFGDKGGYNAYFISSAILGVIGVLFIAMFKKLRSKRTGAVK